MSSGQPLPTHTADGRPIDPAWDRTPKLKMLSLVFALLGVLCGIVSDHAGLSRSVECAFEPALAAQMREESAGHPAVLALREIGRLGRDLGHWWTDWLKPEDDKTRRRPNQPDDADVLPPERSGTLRLAGPLLLLVGWILVFHVWIRPRVAFRADFPKLWSSSIVTRLVLGIFDFVFFGSFGSVVAFYFL